MEENQREQQIKDNQKNRYNQGGLSDTHTNENTSQKSPATVKGGKKRGVNTAKKKQDKTYQHKTSTSVGSQNGQRGNTILEPNKNQGSN